METGHAWAVQVFGDAQLGDGRRTRRLVRLAAGLHARPAGRLTRVYRSAAEREAAFRFVENRSIDPAAIACASHRATARLCASEPMVYVAIDSSSLVLVDRKQNKFGPIGSFNDNTHRGMLAMSALAVDVRGTTLGTTALEWWLRGEDRCPEWSVDRRPLEQRESSLWGRAIRNTLRVMTDHSPGCRPWFQMDRGADCAAVLFMAFEQSLLVTVRANHDRAIGSERLWPLMQKQPVLGELSVRLRAIDGSPARTARLQMRAKRLRFQVANAEDQRLRQRRRWVELTAVYVTENGRGLGGIDWMLWTTHPVRDASDACEVVRGYTLRWRIEDFHRAWKSGGCDIESSQLRGVAALQRWAAMTAAMAAHAEHLKHRARSHPELDAEVELTRDEIDAAIILTRTTKHGIGDKLTLQQAVWLIAQIGGYTGKSSGGPPGAETIGRGLRDVATAAVVLAASRSG